MHLCMYIHKKSHKNPANASHKKERTSKSTCNYRKLMTWALSVHGELKYYNNFKHHRLIFNILAHAFKSVFLFNFNFLLNGCHLSILKLSNIIGSNPLISLLNQL